MCDGGRAPQDIKKNVIGLRIDEKVGNHWRWTLPELVLLVVVCL